MLHKIAQKHSLMKPQQLKSTRLKDGRMAVGLNGRRCIWPNDRRFKWPNGLQLKWPTVQMAEWTTVQMAEWTTVQMATGSIGRKLSRFKFVAIGTKDPNNGNYLI